MNNEHNNSSSGRPLSPHLGIYKPQISSVLSIGHRFSGVGIFIALSMLLWWFIFWVFSKFNPCYLEFMNYSIVKIILGLASFGYFYHLSTGIRHLIWDSGHGFSIKAINIGGWVAIASAYILTICYWINII